MNNFRKHWWSILYGIVLTAFTVYIALDTFVIERASDVPTTEISFRPNSSQSKTNSEEKSGLESSEDDSIPGLPPETKPPESSESSESTEPTQSTELPKPSEPPKPSESFELSEQMGPLVTLHSYTDDNVSIVISQQRIYETECYIADVKLSSAEYLKTAFAKDTFGRNIIQYTSTIAKNADAIFAVNGDYYGVREKGYVIRNGILYQNTANNNQEDLVIYPDGSFKIITEKETTAEQLVAEGAWQVFSFGPALVENGKASVKEGEEVRWSKASNPRTAIGIIDELHYVFVVSDGRTKESAGLSLFQLSEVMIYLGVTTGYNLDGGGSSTMVFDGEVVNKPTSNGYEISERGISDIVFIDR